MRPCAIRPPGRCGRAGESAPSVALPPTSPPAIVWCGDTPVLQSPGDRHDEQHKRKPRLIFTSASQALKIARTQRERGGTRPIPGPRSALGSHGRDSRRARFATMRHDLPCRATSRPFWVAISAPRVHSPTNDLGELYMAQYSALACGGGCM